MNVRFRTWRSRFLTLWCAGTKQSTPPVAELDLDEVHTILSQLFKLALDSRNSDSVAPRPSVVLCSDDDGLCGSDTIDPLRRVQRSTSCQ